MIGIDAGAAWTSLDDGCGRVRAVFTRAVHVDLGRDRLLVIVDRDGPAGPLHLRVDLLPPATTNEPVVLADGRLHIGPRWVDLGSVPVWTPPPVRGRPLVDRLPGTECSALASRGGDVVALLRCGDLDGVATLLGGLGPGLTPAGDDVLAGIVLTLHTFEAVEEHRLQAAIDLVRSTDLSLAYLRWAARGQCIEPAHDVLVAVAGDDPVRLAAAAARLCAHGASSGADLLLGIECAISAFLAESDSQCVVAAWSLDHLGR